MGLVDAPPTTRGSYTGLETGKVSTQTTRPPAPKKQTQYTVPQGPISPQYQLPGRFDYNGSMSQNYNALLGQNAPTFAGHAATGSSIANQLSSQFLLGNNANASAQHGYDTDIALLNIDRLGNMSNQQSAQRDWDFANKAYDIDYRDFQNNWNFTDQQGHWASVNRAIDTDDINARRHASDIIYGADTRDLANAETGIGLENRLAMQQWREQLATGGAGVNQSLGVQRDVTNQQRDLALAGVGNDRTRLNATYDRDKSGYTNEQRKVDQAHAEQLATLDKHRRDLNLDLERSGLSRDQQQAQVQDRMNNLALQAASMGVQADALARSLQLELERLGLQQAISVGQLMDAKNSNDAARAQLAANLIAQAGAQTAQQAQMHLR